MSAKFQYRGDLGATPLPKVLATIHRYGVPGVITARRPDIVKKIFLDTGKVVFATSSDMEDALGAFLVRRGLITPADLEESGRRIAFGGKRQGEVLVDMGVLDPPAIAAAILDQVSGVLWSVFDWDSGEVTFEVGRFRAEEKVQMDLPIDRVIREGIMKVANPKSLVKQLGPSWTILEAVAGATLPPDISPDERTFLSFVDGRTPFVDLCRKGPGDAATNARLLFLFYCHDLVRRKPEPAVKKLHWRTHPGGGAAEGQG
jgi:hypothetical protein